MNKIADIIVVLLSFTPLLASAAQTVDAKSEIIYRASLGRADDIKLLLKQGATPNEKNSEGTPLLALASMRLDPEGINVLKVLVEAGADINAKDASGQTALFYAGKAGNMDVVKYLLAHGIDYYAADNKGNIARNVAYAAGYHAITDAMDAFVKAQGQERTEQYKKFNEAVQERYRQIEESSAPPPREPAPETKVEPEETPPASAPDYKAQQAAKRAAEKAEERKRASEMKAVAGDLSFNNCAFEYWYYCRDVGQDTGMTPNEMAQTIVSYKDKVKTLEDRLSEDYAQTPEAITQISDSAKRRIYNQLNILPSGISRHEHGVGKADDMQMRCKAIALEWDAEPPAELATSPVSSGKGGLVGGSGGGQQSPDGMNGGFDSGMNGGGANNQGMPSPSATHGGFGAKPMRNPMGQ